MLSLNLILLLCSSTHFSQLALLFSKASANFAAVHIEIHVADGTKQLKRPAGHDGRPAWESLLPQPALAPARSARTQWWGWTRASCDPGLTHTGSG